MRIIIIGGVEVGYSLAKALAAQHDIFVIDGNAARGERLTHLDVEFLHGSG